MRTIEDTIIQEDFICLRLLNNTDEKQTFNKDLSTNLLQFHFVLKGKATFMFNEGAYQMPLQEESALTLYNPQKHLPLHLEINPNTWIISILISLTKFHGLFATEAEFIPFLTKENIDRKHYVISAITPAMSVVLYQILNFNLHSSVRKLYYKAKVYELICLLFNKPEGNDDESCPFKNDEENTIKIQQAKDYLLKNMAEPPTLQALSEKVNISTKKLKEGFKQVYGDTVFGFLFDYKMEYARKLLDSGAYNVNDVGMKIGYSTASHFISAFRKKFGTTPKKYIQSTQNNNQPL